MRAIAAVAAVAAWTAVAPRPAIAQDGAAPGRAHSIAATPIGALPPSAMPMPASRNHNYWGGRVQWGVRRGGDEPDQQTAAAGIDLQWRGGSVFGVTAGYRQLDCPAAADDCSDGQLLFGGRARFNVIAGGPTIGALFGDNSATTTLGTEVGVGYAPAAAGGTVACTIDAAVPVSHAMLQTVRLVTFVSAGAVWDVGCGDSTVSRPVYLVAGGFGLQQLGGRALDVHLGAQRTLRHRQGYQLGVTITYLRMP
jgi:hypothetical protein